MVGVTPYYRFQGRDDFFCPLLGRTVYVPKAPGMQIHAGLGEESGGVQVVGKVFDMPGLKERAKTLIELVDGARFLLDERPLKIDDKAKAILTPEARATLKRAIAVLEKAEWNAGALDAAVRALADSEKVKLAAVAQPLRALTGKATSTGIFDVLIALGRDESLARLRDQAGIAAAA